MFASMSLKLKMLFAFMGVAMMLLVVGGMGWYSNKTVVSSYEIIASQNLPNIGTVGRMRYRAQELNRLTLRTALAVNAEEISKNQKAFEESLKIYEDFTKKYNEIPFIEGEAALFDKTESTWKTYVKVSSDVMALAGKPEQKEAMDKIIYGELPASRVAHDEALNTLLKFHEESSVKARAAASAATSRGEMLIVLAIVFGFIAAASIGFFFSSVLSKALSRISEEISSAADQTAASGAELSSASQQLSEGSSEAASSLEETVASLEELSSMVKTNADNAKEANNLSQESSHSAERGENEITKLISAMEEIASGSKKIEEIITVIDDIAFQTNLLALNAAVEAARAGEQGKGFAVVAEAVRNLAQKSAEAAKDINSLIKENVEKSEAGAQIASQSGVVLKDIVTAVKKVSHLNSEISAASQEQANGIEQISKAMTQLDQATQSNAASSEEVASSSEEMSSQASLLKQLVVDLRGLVQGGRAAVQVGSSYSSSGQQKKTSSRPKLKVVASRSEAEKILPLENGSSRSNLGNVSGF